jgi:hypothetical protein
MADSSITVVSYLANGGGLTILGFVAYKLMPPAIRYLEATSKAFAEFARAMTAVQVTLTGIKTDVTKIAFDQQANTKAIEEAINELRLTVHQEGAKTREHQSQISRELHDDVRATMQTAINLGKTMSRTRISHESLDNLEAASATRERA